jgi:putative addiction module component (TIGR02574 family)
MVSQAPLDVAEVLRAILGRGILLGMSIAEIRRLPLNEKLQIMEALWEDLRAHAEDLDVPEWHKEVLDSRRRAVEEGREKVLDWDEVKSSLGPRRT